jgi:PEP-CTERM motif
VIETDATAYKWGFVSAQDGTAGSARAYIPAVPEPSSLALVGGGLSTFGLLLRKRLGKSV